MSSPLRVCKICGLVANTPQDLNQFVKESTSKFGRARICVACYNKAHYDKYFKSKRVIVDLLEHPLIHKLDQVGVCQICKAQDATLYQYNYNPNDVSQLIHLCDSCREDAIHRLRMSDEYPTPNALQIRVDYYNKYIDM
jgi:hypothetical protein